MGCSNGVGCVYGGFRNIFMFFLLTGMWMMVIELIKLT